jgi:signal transduction histidine kinase
MVTDEPDRGRSTARRVATGVVVALGVLWAARLVLGLSTGSLTDQSSWVLDVVFDLGALVFSGIFVLVGWAIVTRQPRNTIGWLLLAIPFVGALAFVVGDYAAEALAVHPGSLPFGSAAAWLDRWLIVATLAIFVPVFLLFPDGKIPSRRWRPALWLTVAAPGVTIVSFALTPGRLTGAFADLSKVTVMNPLGVEALRRTLEVLTQVGGFGILLSAFLAGAAIIVRFRGASGDVRQQIRWLAFVGIAFLAEFVIGAVLAGMSGDNDMVGTIAFTIWFLTLVVGIPISCGIAILRYRLYDLDVVVRKTVVFGLLAVFITAVYAAVVGLAGTVIGSTVGSTVGSFAAAAALAVLFQPARERARRLADHVVYGRRATPYEVLAEFSGRVGEVYAAEDVLDRMATVLAEGTGAERATVSVLVDGELRAIATAPQGEPATGTSIDVSHHGEALGALSVDMSAADPMDPARRKLVEDLAAQAGLVLRNVRLIEQLRASRQRLVAAQDEERRKLERNLHDGAQQQLVALSVRLKLARTMVDRDPGKVADMLEAIQGSANDALEDLRDLARGIYPPLLADKGLVVALEAQARKSTIPTVVDAQELGRYSQEVEAAVYFSCLEALQNVAKYAQASTATVRLGQDDGVLRFEVDDDGDGFDPAATGYGTGLQGIADRLDAIGGEIAVRSSPGRGTTIAGRIPVETRHQ